MPIIVGLIGDKDHHLVNHLGIRIKNVSAAIVQKELANSGILVGIGTESRILSVIGRTPAEGSEMVLSLLIRIPCDGENISEDKLLDNNICYSTFS